MEELLQLDNLDQSDTIGQKYKTMEYMLQLDNLDQSDTI